jgi:succinate dehydrogenase hydrophobic anchor subunit
MKKWFINNMCFLSAMLILSSVLVCFFIGMGSIKTDTITPLQFKIILVCLGE